ncbi:MAG: PepSY-associated TM helix domain-containing protein [Pseudomonadota bacterium]
MATHNKFNWLKFYSWSRWLHLYISTVLFATLVFFAITGITLNNSWYDDASGNEGELEIELSETLRAGLREDSWDPDLSALRATVADATGLGEPSRVELFAEYQEVTFEYALPAGQALATLTPDRAWLEYETGSLLALANALHKSRDGGAVWSVFVDVAAVGMLLFAITGITILFQNRRRRRSALLSVALGLLTPVGLYLLFVPGVG